MVSYNEGREKKKEAKKKEKNKKMGRYMALFPLLIFDPVAPTKF
jgi:hypothetical protein